MMQQLILLGTFFVLPVYLQVVLGLDAFETGKRLFPMSVTMFIAALAGPRLAAGLAPKRVAQVGPRCALVVASLVLLATIDVELNGAGFAIALSVFGVGRGPAAVAARQRDHVVGRREQDQRGGRPAGDGAEPRRLARHGPDRLGSDRRAEHRLRLGGRGEPRDPAARPASRSNRPRRRASPSCRSTEVEQAAEKEGLSEEQADAIGRRTTATRSSRGSSARSARSGIFALLSLWFTRGLPGREPPPVRA